jgi:hypothetical protein
MKKTIVNCLIILLLTGCTSGSPEEISANEIEAEGIPLCLNGLTAKVSVDVSGGLDNPIIVFTPALADDQNQATAFSEQLEVQPLADIDDLDSDTGAIISFGPQSGTVQDNLSLSPILIVPAQLPMFYKWRISVIKSDSSGQVICVCYSQWQESPLFKPSTKSH